MSVIIDAFEIVPAGKPGEAGAQANPQKITRQDKLEVADVSRLIDRRAAREARVFAH